MISAPAWVGDSSLVLLSLLVQGIPFLLLGALLGGVVSVWLPTTTWLRRWPRAPVRAALAGTCGALLLPACDCAVLPMARRLIRKGAPLSSAIAYLLAAPTLNPICLISTWLAFRLSAPWEMVALRAGGTLLLAVIIGVVASRLAPGWLLRADVLFRAGGQMDDASWMEPKAGSGPVRRKIATVVGVSLTDFLNVSTLYVLGALASAILQTFLPFGKIVTGHGTMGIPAAMLLAFLFSLCSSADAFVVNAFGALGTTGQLAFLWLGPVCNFRVLVLYRALFRYPAIAAFALAAIMIAGTMAAVVGALGIR